MALPRLIAVGPDLRWLMISRSARSVMQGYLTIVVPLYLVQIGFSAAGIGSLATATAVASVILTVSVGVLSDRFGRKPFLLWYPIMAGIATLMFGFTRFLPLLFVSAAVASLGRSGGAGGAGGGPVYPAQQALMADLAPSRTRSQIFAQFSMVDTVSSAVGALIAGLPNLLVGLGLVTDATRYESLFVLGALLSVVSALAVLPVRVMPTARQRRSAQDASQRQQRRRQSFSVIRRLAFTNFVNGIGVSFYSPFVSYYFYTRFGQSSASIGLLFALVSITSLIPYFVGPALAARAGLVNTVVGIRVAGVVLLALLPLMPVYVFAALCYLLRMVVQRASVPLRQSFSMGVVSPEDRATVASLSNVPSQVAAAAVPPLAGRIFDTVSAVLPFELGSFFQLINAVSYYVLFRREQLPEEGVSRGTVDPSPAPNAQHGG